MPSARSRPRTVRGFLASLSNGMREEVVFVRDLINRSIPKGYLESYAYGMITWSVPLSVYPHTYNKQPLGLAALGVRKDGLTLHLFGAYASPELRQRLEEGFANAGKKLDMGKGCLRFRTRADLALEVIEEAIGALTPADFVGVYEDARRIPGSR